MSTLKLKRPMGEGESRAALIAVLNNAARAERTARSRTAFMNTDGKPFYVVERHDGRIYRV